MERKVWRSCGVIKRQDRLRNCAGHEAVIKLLEESTHKAGSGGTEEVMKSAIGFLPRLGLSVFCVGMLISGAAAANDNRWERPIWKYRVPANIQGEFGNEDVIGLAAGKHIKADCSLNWVSQEGKIYCFSSSSSLQNFLEAPQEHLRRAREFWLSEQRAKGGR